MLKISDYFNVSIDYLLGKTDITDPVEDIIKKKELANLNKFHSLSPNSKTKVTEYIDLLKCWEEHNPDSK